MADAQFLDEPIEIQPIQTQRLVLRAASHFDLAAFHELHTNKEVMRWW